MPCQLFRERIFGAVGRSGSHGQPRQTRPRKEEAKESANQAVEPSGETGAGIQTASGTTATTANWRNIELRKKEKAPAATGAEDSIVVTGRQNNAPSHTPASGKESSAWRNPKKRAEFECELRKRIGEDLHAEKYLAYLVSQGFDQRYVVRSLVRDALGYSVPEDLSDDPEGDRLKEYGSPAIAQRARELANEIEQAELDTPNFGLDQLDNFGTDRSKNLGTEGQRQQAVDDLHKLPNTLRLYADYFDQSRRLWKALGRVTEEAKERLERAVRDLLQIEIHRRTGKHSDLRYSHLVNLAREVVGKEAIDPKVLVARRVRRQAKR